MSGAGEEELDAVLLPVRISLGDSRAKAAFPTHETTQDRECSLLFPREQFGLFSGRGNVFGRFALFV